MLNNEKKLRKSYSDNIKKEKEEVYKKK